MPSFRIAAIVSRDMGPGLRGLRSRPLESAFQAKPFSLAFQLKRISAYRLR